MKPVRLTDLRQHQRLDFSLKLEAYSRKDTPEIAKVTAEVYERLELNHPSKRFRENLAAILCNLIVAWQTPGNPFLAIPLRRGAYSPGERLHALYFRYTAVRDIIDRLEKSALIDRYAGFYDGTKGRSTRIRATPALIKVFLAHRFPLRQLRIEHDLIVLRDELKQPINITRGPHSHEAKKLSVRVEALNAFHGSACWELALPEEKFIEYFLRRAKPMPPPNPTSTELHRVFNCGFDRGGRFYGIWPHGIPRQLRQYIMINGQATIERDFRAIHPTILYAWAGSRLAEDPYIIPGYGEYRKPIKLLFNMALNASTNQEAMSAFRHEIKKSHELIHKYGHTARNIWLKPAYAAMCHYHRAIAEHLSSGVGTRLQRIDADIAEKVLFDLIAQGIPAIPVHDSFIVPEYADTILAEVMKSASLAVVGVAIPTDLKTHHDKANQTNIDQVISNAYP